MNNTEHPINELMGVTMEKIREMVDVNTIVGTPITCADGATIIPISKVSYGFASGGSDLPSKVEKELFGGGSGAGISIQPVAFLVILNGEVKLLQLSIDASTPNALINMVPDVMEKISGYMSSRNEKNAKAE
ncbi:GerW family sporulation protein [Ruminococcus sp.]|uniref:GerW family sporulation protein n=1 Tax=Ruminococcus sp. TaxID=41978 RepID=UPI0025D50198|nr:GerW family sporulation protein [Ruminococcus sp.]MCI5815997.1 GerW family sporulation protein [Ruminococcus sp.]MDD7555828.1 GerW family sporulation protein [Ruminococcus sp.]MDY4964514.1 GerW family sporulation protein [Ruminococcus callidus]